LFETSLFFLG